MANRNVTSPGPLLLTALYLLLAVSLVTGTGCDPVSYFSKNACDFFNCDVVFFLEDIFPLSARPAGSGGGGGGGAAVGNGGGNGGDGDGGDNGDHVH